jgi:diguanylate cyclase (GGDEF)-like protein/PAS domain S-box-containing protein
MPEEGLAVERADRPEHILTGSLDDLLRSFADDGQIMLLALRRDGVVAYVSGAVQYVLGYQPHDLVGRNVLEILHPDDTERVIWQLAGEQAGQIERGITKFLAAHADGSWMPVEVLASVVTDGEEPLIGIYGRKGLHDVLLEDILALLLTGSPRADALAPVTNSIQWYESGSHLAISWEDETGLNQVSTGLPDALGGGDGREGTPWSEARQRPADRMGSADGLPAELGLLAGEHGLAEYWIRPVGWSARWPDALVTIWTTGGTRSPILHSYGMEVATNLCKLILRWTEQLEQLERAARRDSLTGLANRRAFFDALDGTNDGGALLYCDLDGFKPVNDRHGHTVGDHVLRVVALRLESCVRERDVVARLGGDEFGILCEGATEAEALVIAERIRSALQEPFRIEDVDVVIGVSVGIASDPEEMSEHLLDKADRALVEAKATAKDLRRRREESPEPVP